MKTPRWLFLLLCLAAPAHAETPDSDAKAVAIADRVMTALGGRARWDALPGLEWTFEVVVNDTARASRHHLWNKHTGWHKVEGKTRTGQPFVFIDQLDSGKGMAWMAGTPMEGDTVPKLTKRAHSMWTNDSYWFLMPYKLRDPGVHLKYAGDTTTAGVTYDRLALSFENVGETPGDHYWIWVNRANDRVERWQYILQGQQPPPEVWTWEGWEQHDGLWFPTAHRQEKTVIFTHHVSTLTKFAPTAFSAP